MKFSEKCVQQQQHHTNTHSQKRKLFGFSLINFSVICCCCCAFLFFYLDGGFCNILNRVGKNYMIIRMGLVMYNKHRCMFVCVYNV